MTRKPHLVVVETNSVGLDGLATAGEMGLSVTFVHAPGQEGFYGGRKGAAAVRERVDRTVEVADSFDAGDLSRALEEIASREPIDGVVTFLEYCTSPLAEAAAELGLLYNPPAAVATARDKVATRAFARKAGLSPLSSERVAVPAEAVVFAEMHGWPVVLKPARGGASLFVSVCRSPADVQAAFARHREELPRLEPRFRRAIGDELLVEPYLSGRMLSVEAMLSRGEFQVLTIGERKRARANEAVELGTTMPAALSAAEWETASALVEALVRGLGFERGAFHAEVMATAKGLELIELNPRLMGGGLPRVYRYTYGDDVYRRLFTAHLGHPLPPPPPPPARWTASRIFGPAHAGQVRSRIDLGWADEFAADDLELDLAVEPDQPVRRLESNHDYLGNLRLRAATPEAAAARADEAIERLGAALGIPLTT